MVDYFVCKSRCNRVVLATASLFDIDILTQSAIDTSRGSKRAVRVLSVYGDRRMTVQSFFKKRFDDRRS